MTGEVLSSKALLAEILTSLNEDKAEEVVEISLRGKSEMADYMVIASGRSARQVAAMVEHLVAKLKQDHGRQSKVEGKDAGDWVLIDTGDVIVHLFRPEVREFYQLEKMWLSPGEAARVYLEKFEDDADRLNFEAKEALAEVIETAHDIARIKEHTGRTAPDVKT